MSRPVEHSGSRGIGLRTGWVLALALAAIFATLGSWQLGRMQDKLAMLDAAAQAMDRTRTQPLLLASDPSRSRDYDWAVGTGSLGGATVWLDNQLRSGKAGLRMYCVLLPDDGVQAVLVDAGWIALDGVRTLPAFGCPTQTAQAVRGLLAPPPSSGLVHGDALASVGSQRWLATRLDLAAIAREMKLSAGIAPRVLRLDPARARGDTGVMLVPGERDLDILPNTLPAQRHLGYAVQWFAMALAVLVIATVLTLRSRRSR